jgi:hypothetical protein
VKSRKVLLALSRPSSSAALMPAVRASASSRSPRGKPRPDAGGPDRLPQEPYAPRRPRPREGTPPSGPREGRPLRHRHKISCVARVAVQVSFRAASGRLAPDDAVGVVPDPGGRPGPSRPGRRPLRPRRGASASLLPEKERGSGDASTWPPSCRPARGPRLVPPSSRASRSRAGDWCTQSPSPTLRHVSACPQRRGGTIRPRSARLPQPRTTGEDR